jgi:DNA-binding NarL/FixJ family response regulator
VSGAATESAAPRVLLVDDEPLLRRSLKRVLEARGLEIVGEAADGTQAVALCGDLRPEVVVMDLRMPVMDGLTATRHIHDSWPSIAVIVCTAYDDPALQREVIDAGAWGFLVKGDSPGALYDSIVEARADQADA